MRLEDLLQEPEYFDHECVEFNVPRADGSELTVRAYDLGLGIEVVITDSEGREIDPASQAVAEIIDAVCKETWGVPW